MYQYLPLIPVLPNENMLYNAFKTRLLIPRTPLCLQLKRDESTGGF